MTRVSIEKVAQYIWEHYGGCTIAKLRNKNGNIVPKCYVAYYSNPIIFTRDRKKANKYKYIEV